MEHWVTGVTQYLSNRYLQSTNHQGPYLQHSVRKCPLFTGDEPEKYLQFFDIVPGFIRKKNLKTDTDELKVAIKDKQLLLDSHLAMEPKWDVTSEYVTDSDAEDEEDGD